MIDPFIPFVVIRDYYNQLFTRVPATLRPSFYQHWLLAVVTRIRWLFWAGLLFQIVLLSVDWLRYRTGDLPKNPVHLSLFYTHVASTILVIAYYLTGREAGAVRQGRVVRAGRWLLFIYGFLTIQSLIRAVLAYYDRQTLVMYVAYLLVIQVLLLVGHRGRFLISIISVGVVLPTVWFSQTGVSLGQYVNLVEVILFTLGVFSLGTYLYNGFAREFIQNQLIEAQNQTLKRQAVLLEHEQSRAVQELGQRSQELLSYVLQEQQRNAFLLELKERIAHTEPNRLIWSIDHQLNQEDRWKYFVELFERLHPTFFGRLQTAYPPLNAHDLRLIAMLKLNLSTKEISMLLGISPQSANTARYRLRKRLDLPPETTLESFLQQY